MKDAGDADLSSADFRFRRRDCRVRSTSRRAPWTLYGEHGPEVVAAVVAHHEANGGISRRKKIRHCHETLLGTDLDGAKLETLCQRFSALVEDEVVGCDWVPGARGCSPANLRGGRCSSFPEHRKNELTRIIERRGLAPWFTEVHGSPPEKATTIRSILARHDLDPHGAVRWRCRRRLARRVGDGGALYRPASRPRAEPFRQAPRDLRSDPARAVSAGRPNGQPCGTSRMAATLKR